MRPLLTILAAVIGISGCNQYELFRLAGYQQENFSNKADLLFIIDNSDSMMEEAASLATNFDKFITQLTENDQGEAEGLNDAVSDYIRFVRDRSAFVNYQLAITTTDVEATYGALYGSPPVLTKGESGIEDDFIANLLCDATCFGEDVVIDSDPAHDCGDELGDNVSRQYLDCACGTDAWRGNCGAGTEEGLEAIFMALCRAVEKPPEACYDIVNQFTEADVLSNEGMLRPNATFMPIIITDEGDYGTRRMSQGEADIAAYIDLYERFYLRISPVVIGPVWDPDFGDFRCPTGAGGGWSALRYTQLVDNYGGLQINIVDPDNNCEPTPFSDSLAQIGDLLKSLLDSFPLQSIPIIDTITVRVNNQPVERAEEYMDVYGTTRYEDGWSYRGKDNAVVLNGSAVPEYNAKVQIFYLPLEGMPRDLPF
jgi:hypothetical protein